MGVHTTLLKRFAQCRLITRTEGARLLCVLPPSLPHLCYDSVSRVELLWPEYTPRSTLPAHATPSIFSWHESLCINAAVYTRT